MVLQIGHRVGPYEVLGRVGVGGMGVVYRAWDSRLLREVAVKMLRPEFSTPAMRARFLQEARAVSPLSHPHICTIFDIGQHEGHAFLVMELLRGETLRARMERSPLPTAEVLQIAEETADALGAAHRLGVIHRDIKPANIFLSQHTNGGFTTKVLDFGLAKIEAIETEMQAQAALEYRLQTAGGTPRPHSLRGQDLTEPRATLGTVGYMSPEQARGEELDPRSDLFSLGVVLYEAASGQPPFRGETHALTFVQLLSHAPEPIHSRVSDFPPALEGVLLQLLEKDRSKRFANAADLHRALTEASQARPSGVPRRLWRGATRALRRSNGTPAPEGLPKRSGAPAPQPSTTRLRPARIPVRIPSRPPGQRETTAAERSPSESSATPDSGTAPTPPVQESFGAYLPLHNLPSLPPPPKLLRGWAWLAAGIIAAAVLAVAAALHLRQLHEGQAVAGQPRVLVLAQLQNRTDDPVLSGVVAAGLRLALEQSPHLSIRSQDDLHAAATATGGAENGTPGREQLERSAAAIGGTDLLVAELHQKGGAYALDAYTYNVASGRETAHAQESVPSRELLVESIDRLALDLRGSLGEAPAMAARTARPLRAEATGNLDALAAVASGEHSLANNQMPEALHAFLAATAADAHFPQGWLELADLYRRQHASLSAGDSAILAAQAAGSASEHTRLLAEAGVALYATGDLPRAASLLGRAIARFPRDERARTMLSLALRGQGRYVEARAAAAEVLAHNPWNFDATGQAEIALLAMDQPDEAEHLEDNFARSGRSHTGVVLLMRYLGSRDNIQRATDVSTAPDRVAAQEYGAALLDAGGLFSAGMTAWQATARRAASTPELRGSASDALSTAALDRALIGDCVTAIDAAGVARELPSAAESIFRQGMAEALCNQFEQAAAALDALGKTGQAFAVKGFYRQDLTATLQLREGNAVGALATLDRIRAYDRVSLSPYLRGLAHLNTDQGSEAVQDFQQVLRHPGSTTLVNPVVWPMAQFQLARAYAATADASSSAASYGSFLDLWHGADANLAIVQEARNAAGQSATGTGSMIPQPKPR